MTIREQADVLLRQTGLLDTLRRFGEPVIVGSYAMDAMAWNDLDVYIDLAGDYHEMAAAVIAVLKPYRYDGFCDRQTGAQFAGMETVITGERWNIDIWVRSRSEIDAAVERNRAMKAQFDARPEVREAVLRIKQELIGMGMYGFDKGKRHYHSPEIYEAVLEKGVRTVGELLEMYPV